MAINFTDFSRAPILQNKFAESLGNLFENFAQGQQIGALPQKLRDEAKQRELANKMKTLELEQAPEKFDLEKRYKEALKQKALQMIGGRELTPVGELRNFVYANPQATKEEIRQKNSELQNLYQAGKKASAEHIDKLTNTQDRRDQTNQGKLLAELKDVEDGFIPGTDRNQSFENKAQQDFYRNQYQDKLLKERTDTQQRNRSLNAGLVDNTFDQINVENMVRYSGLMNKIQQKIDQNIPLTKQDDDNFTKFREEMAKVNTLNKQLRQFYGDSISPSNLQKIEAMINPTNWQTSPKVAAAEFEALKKLVKQETALYRVSMTSLSNAVNPQNENKSEANLSSDPLGLF
jgi:hypothetical protein